MTYRTSLRRMKWSWMNGANRIRCPTVNLCRVYVCSISRFGCSPKVSSGKTTCRVSAFKVSTHHRGLLCQNVQWFSRHIYIRINNLIFNKRRKFIYPSQSICFSTYSTSATTTPVPYEHQSSSEFCTFALTWEMSNLQESQQPKRLWSVNFGFRLSPDKGVQEPRQMSHRCEQEMLVWTFSASLPHQGIEAPILHGRPPTTQQSTLG